MKQRSGNGEPLSLSLCAPPQHQHRAIVDLLGACVCVCGRGRWLPIRSWFGRYHPSRPGAGGGGVGEYEPLGFNAGGGILFTAKDYFLAIGRQMRMPGKGGAKQGEWRWHSFPAHLKKSAVSILRLSSPQYIYKKKKREIRKIPPCSGTQRRLVVCTDICSSRLSTTSTSSEVMKQRVHATESKHPLSC